MSRWLKLLEVLKKEVTFTYFFSVKIGCSPINMCASSYYKRSMITCQANTLKHVKSDASSPKLPTSKAQWEKVIALAPGEDRLPTSAENAARKNAVNVRGGGYAAVRDALAKKRQGQRRPQQKPTKLAVTVRCNPEVIAYFEATGDGWQTRMNDALRDWVAEHRAA